ncbi:hypothetical protein R3W88_018076 [Solanum pinnatisectum]|uniref:Uncharacterized protein n=1 Tax=Solanum pinnatisectum TaxID=50273 RepID=A0AAV9L2X0_9SOLN|nr:hypothetical protein R3W88_018076 [Solanum pinnatisectum]
MMMFEEIDVEVAALHTEPDEDFDLDELERRLWRDKMKLKEIMNQDKEDVDSAKRWLFNTQGKKSRRDEIWRAQDGFRSDRINRCAPLVTKRKHF